MSITREQVADLREGDVVELACAGWPEGTVVRGALHGLAHSLFVGPVRLHEYADGPWETINLTVVSRAPRPLYVNHPRTEPVPGDVVRDADSSNDRHVWVKNVAGFSNEWLAVPGHVYVPTSQLPDRLRLLVDGETGQVVPS